MARPARIPDPLARRHLLERELDPARALAIAEAYLAQSRSVDAVLFLSKAGAAERLEQLAEEAVQDGDAFLLELVARELDAPPSAARWRALAERARAAGLLEYAVSAERHADAVDTTGGSRARKE
jgi:hypothetical protein